MIELLTPLTRAGGVFLTIVGVFMTLGALRFRDRYAIFAVGGAIASVALVLVARPLSAPYGAPSALQLWSIAAGMAFEIIALALLIPRAARSGERAMTLTILLIVGAHFVIMTPAFGTWILALGAANIANALVGVRLTSYRLSTLWFVDGLLKGAIGLAMITTIR